MTDQSTVVASQRTSIQGFIVIDDDNEGPCILYPYFTTNEKDRFDIQVAAGKVEDGRRVFSYLWLESPVTSEDAEDIAVELRPFGNKGNLAK